jgi:Protein of unknown function (DUF3311)
MLMPVPPESMDPGFQGAITPLRLFAAFCVLAPTIAVIAVPTYNSATPKLGGFPFFYWYQLLLVVATGILMVAAYWAMKIDARRRKQFRAGADAARDGGEAGA